MPTWVVTGADRGIGVCKIAAYLKFTWTNHNPCFFQYEFVRKLSSDPANLVFSLALNKSATEANHAEHQISRVKVFEADVRDRNALLVGHFDNLGSILHCRVKIYPQIRF